MFRPKLLLAALLCGTLFIGQAAADNAWFSLNLEFNDPTDFGSGGTWTVVAKADERGFAAVVLSLTASTVNFNPATGFLTPGVWEIEDSQIDGLRLETVQGDDVSLGPTYDIGVIGGTYPSSYVDDPDLILYGANPDLGSFTGGVELVTGTFDAGDIPAWFTASDPTTGNLFTGVGTNVIEPDVFLTVRYVGIPEPTSMLLLGGGMLALAAIRRR